MFMISLSVLFLGQDFFGYESEAFSNFSFSAMTIFKMMIGRLIGVYY